MPDMGRPNPGWDEDDEVAPERRTRLGQLLQRPKDRLAYADANSIESALTHERKTLGKYRQLKTGLMTDLLTDRIRVPEGVEL
jgi:hypothetical protein